ncbi:hypothetical protein HDU76_011088, partial [Blyttiomyces sp. JEL0837]
FPKSTVMEEEYNLTESLGYVLTDTSGSKSLDRLRPYSYENATGFLICFAVDDPDSMLEVSEK